MNWGNANDPKLVLIAIVADLFQEFIVGIHKRFFQLGAAASLALFSVNQAKGNLMLTLVETGFAPVTVIDTLNTGALSFFGTYGDFQTNFVAGVSDKLNSPPPSAATLQIQSINVKNLSSAGLTKTLSLTLTDDGYTFPGVTGSSMRLDSSFGGSFTSSAAGDTTTFQSYVISPATTTGLQTYTAPVSDPGTTAFSTNVIPVVFTRPSTFTLQNVTTISLTNAFEQANLAGTTTVSASTPVPEPATLIGGILAPAVLLRRRRRV